MSSPLIASARRRDRPEPREESAHRARSDRQLESAITVLEDGDRRAERRMELGIGQDVTIDEGRGGQPVRRPARQERLEQLARLVTQAAAGLAIEHEPGRGGVGHGGDATAHRLGATASRFDLSLRRGTMRSAPP
jgi:hypothetical protein